MQLSLALSVKWFHVFISTASAAHITSSSSATFAAMYDARDRDMLLCATSVCANEGTCDIYRCFTSQAAVAVLPGSYC